MKTRVLTILIAGMIIAGSNAHSALDCGEPPLICTVNYMDVDEPVTRPYPFWVDCYWDGNAFWTADGDMETAPDSTTLEDICTAILEESRAEIIEIPQDLPTEICTVEEITCTVAVDRLDTETDLYPLLGYCVNTDLETMAFFDDSLMEIPSAEEFASICRMTARSHLPIYDSVPLTDAQTGAVAGADMPPGDITDTGEKPDSAADDSNGCALVAPGTPKATLLSALLSLFF